MLRGSVANFDAGQTPPHARSRALEFQFRRTDGCCSMSILEFAALQRAAKSPTRRPKIKVCFVRTVIIRDVRMLRDARTTAMRKLHRGVKSAGQRQDWAGSGSWSDQREGCRHLRKTAPTGICGTSSVKPAFHAVCKLFIRVIRHPAPSLLAHIKSPVIAPTNSQPRATMPG